MPKFTSRAGEAAKRAAKDVEQKVLVAEGRRSIKAKVARVKRVTKKALKAGVIAGAIAAVSVVLKERKRRRELDD